MASEVTDFRFEIRAVIHFCCLRGLDNASILAQLKEAYPTETITESVVKKWGARFRRGRRSLADDPRSGRPRTIGVAQSIEEFLDDQPFASVRTIASELGYSRGTVFRALTQDLGFHKFVSKWVPHRLSDHNKAERVRLSGEMLRRIGDPNIEVITVDESWFYHDYSQSGRWARKASDVEPRVMPGIGSKKTMLTVFWSAAGFHLVDVLPAGLKFNSVFACAALGRLDTKLREDGRPGGLRGVMFHWDNARPHTSTTTRTELERLGAIVLGHPPYSPDLAPSDFFLFGHIKRLLGGYHFENAGELLSMVVKIIDAITKEMRENVFLSGGGGWMW